MNNGFNIFNTIDELWMDTISSLLNDGFEVPSRVGNTKEIVAFSVSLASIDQTFLLNKRRRLSPVYACAEFLWYLKHTKNIEMIRAYAPQYHKFAENDEAFGAYGWRLYKNLRSSHNVSQLELLIQHLTETSDSRQAIVTLWEADDLYHARKKDHKDLPCTLSMQFVIRRGKLHLITTMRSNDAWLGLPYDVFAFTCVQRLVANAINVEPGMYTHQVGSMHLYEKNWAAADEALESKYDVDYRRLTHEWSRRILQWKSQVQTALLAEGRYRSGNVDITEHRKLYDMLYDVVACCSKQFNGTRDPRSPILQEALKNIKDKGEK